MKNIIFSLFILLNATMLPAQSDYAMAFGLRAGNPLAADGKYFFSDKIAAEAIVGLQFPRGWGVTALAEYHGDIGWRGEMNWFVGAGASAMYNRDNRFTFGGDLIGGIEYTFPTLPLNFSMDWKPSYDTYYRFRADQIALTLRYALK